MPGQPRKHTCRLQILKPLLFAALPLVTIIGTATSLTACGFHLRGYDAPLRFDATKTVVVLDDDRVSFPLKLPLINRLEALGVNVADTMTLIEDASVAIDGAEQDVAVIKVNNVRFRRYELVGVLTEIRLVLSADVTYEVTQNGQPVTLTNLIQVERSYQFNEASVSTDDQQGDQIRDWLYNSLARRITDQYVAIALPKVAPARVNQSAQIEQSSATTTVITPIPVAP